MSSFANTDKTFDKTKSYTFYLCTTHIHPDWFVGITPWLLHTPCMIRLFDRRVFTYVKSDTPVFVLQWRYVGSSKSIEELSVGWFIYITTQSCEIIDVKSGDERVTALSAVRCYTFCVFRIKKALVRLVCEVQY